ncbi:PAP2 superfamily-domain-containing protein [Apodospora peruviana]|uniref:PAP2 superfamily-domain-containing protein n=1 Tax=Apodospora peruviana TaxID=516989 RepID=A0AAE0IUC8_9PEZI|nr:PAP2 superfamily-domain-containing protein [Apodospora peruviana]
MAVGAVLEPLMVVSLLTGGTLINRNNSYVPFSARRNSNLDTRPRVRASPDDYDIEDLEAEKDNSRDDSWSRSRSSSASTIFYDPEAGSLGGGARSVGENSDITITDSRWRHRTLRFFGREREVVTPNTDIYRDRFLSRVLGRFPFLVEVWYWALIYWVYQLGRAFTAVTLQVGTVNAAREHALQVIHVEQWLGIFVELDVQRYFLQYPSLMKTINRIYSFIHIPGTILFLIVLFYLTTTRPQQRIVAAQGASKPWRPLVSHFGPATYEKRRRTMAMCNLLAFIVFTFWPCMPPRLLSDPTYDGELATEAKSFGFVDTVHGADGDSSVWTTNKFCNQYAAMPSLHFGYSFLIGLTVATVPLRGRGRFGWKRLAAIVAGMIYPAIILTAIVATANHFVLDAVAGACACIIAWHCNGFLLNLLPLEDYFLSMLRIHKP